MEAVTGEATWITMGLFATAVAGLLFLLALSRRIDRSIRRVRHPVICPETSAELPAELLFDESVNKWTSVQECDGVRLPACHQGCLKAMNGQV